MLLAVRVCPLGDVQVFFVQSETGRRPGRLGFQNSGDASIGLEFQNAAAASGGEIYITTRTYRDAAQEWFVGRRGVRGQIAVAIQGNHRVLHSRKGPVEFHFQDGARCGGVERIIRPRRQPFNTAQLDGARLQTGGHQRQLPIRREPANLQSGRNHPLVVADKVEITVAMNHER